MPGRGGAPTIAPGSARTFTGAVRPVWYLVRAVLRAQWRGAAAIAVLVAVVGAPVLALSAGVLRTLSAPERYAAAIGGSPDVSLEQAGGQPRADEVLALPSVAAAELATFVFGGVTEARRGTPVEGFVFAGSHLAFGARVTGGRLPDEADPGQFVATPSWLAEARAEVGDLFEVRTITQAQADEAGFDVSVPAGPTLAATLVGVIDGPSELEDETPLALFGPALLDVGDEGGVGVASSVGLVTLAPAATVEDLRAELDELPGGASFGLAPAELVPPELRSAVRAQGQGLAVVAAIVAIAVLAVIGQLASRRVRRSPSQRLTVEALGLTRAQVVAEPLGAIALPIGAGCLLASAVAYATSALFPLGFAWQVEPGPGLRFEPVVHVLGAILLAVLLLLWVLAALVLPGRGTRPTAPSGLAELLASRCRPGPIATGVRAALTRHPRDPSSVRASLLGLVLVLSVLVGALTFGASLSRFIDEPARYGSNFDFATGTGGDAVPGEVRDLLEDDPDVADVTFYGTLLASVGVVELDVTGMQPVRGTLEPALLSGRLARTDGEIALGRVAARQLDVGVGDEVAVLGADGPATFVVTGLAVIPSIEGGDGIGEGAVVTLEGLRRLDPLASLGVAAVRLRPGATGAAARIGAALGIEVGLPDLPPTVVNLARVRSTPFVVAASLGALAVLSISHQLLVSARRRRRDLAVLRAIGADRRWLTSVLHWQATALAAAVTVLAVPLGIASGRLAYRAYVDRLGAGADLEVPSLLLVGCVVVLVTAANVTALVPARRVRRDRPALVLGTE